MTTAFKHFRSTAIFFLVCLGFTSVSQTDSLRQRLGSSLRDSVKLEILNTIAFDFRSRDADSTLFYARSAYLLANSIENSKWISRSMYNIGVGHHIKGVFDSAVFYYQNAIPLAREADDQKGLSKLFNNLGLVDWNKGSLRTALDYFLKSYGINEKIRDRSGMVSSINNIGLVHQNLGEYESALRYFLQAGSLLEKLGGDFRLSQLHNNLGLIYQRLKKLDSSMIHYKKSLQYAKKADASCYIAHPYAGIASLMSMIKDSSADSLLFYAQKSVEISAKCGLPKIQSAAMVAMGDGYAKVGLLAEAEKTYQKALEQAKEYSILASLRDSYRGLYQIKKKQKNWEEAFNYFERFETVKSKIVDAEKIAEIALVEAKYESDKEKRGLLAEQEKERFLFENQVQEEKATRNFYLVLTVACMIVIILLLVIYQRERKAISALRRKNRLIQELSNFKIELINMIAHDIKNPLNSIIRLSEQIDRKVGADISKAGQAILRLITNMLDVEKYEEAKPNLKLEELQLTAILEEVSLAVELLLHDKSISLVVAIERDAIINADKDLITRVFVNLVSNAIKYSPSNESIKIVSKRTTINGVDYVKVGVSDRGPGIPEAEQEFIFEKFYQRELVKLGMTPSTGLGLSFCKMAVQAHDGTISVDSEENLGSTFWVTLEATMAPVVDHQELKNYRDLIISESDRHVLASYSRRLKELKIYKVSAIMAILDEVEALELNTKWPHQVRSAVQYSNKARFEELLSMVS